MVNGNIGTRDKFFRLKVRLGAKKATIAIAHKILVSIFYILRDNVSYNELGEGYLTRYDKNRVLNKHVNGLERLGYKVVLVPNRET